MGLGRTGGWVIHWPSEEASLWICSPHRLPQVVEIRRSRAPRAGAAPLRLAAAPGDAVVALSRPAPAGLAPPSPAEGAPAWFDRAIEAHSAGRPAGALAIEMRP